MLLLAVVAWAITCGIIFIAYTPAQLDVATLPKRQPNTNAIPKTRWDFMDVRPFLSSSLTGSGSAVPKGISVSLGGTNEAAAVCFDTELLRMDCGWTGGFLKFPHTFTGLGSAPRISGTVRFSNPPCPGWSRNGSFSDPRQQFDGKPYGNLPREWGHYKGLYIIGNRVIFSYTIGDSEVLESADFEQQNGIPCFTRTFDIARLTEPMTLQVCGGFTNAPTFAVEPRLVTAKFKQGGVPRFILATINGAPTAAAWNANTNTGLRLHLLKSESRLRFQVRILYGEQQHLVAARSSAQQFAPVPDLKELTRNPVPQTGPVITTRGIVGQRKGAFQVDTLTLPVENPWNSWIRPSGIDFFSDGRAAICSISGEVWIASGLDSGLEQLEWKRFAHGLHQPLGLKIVKDDVYVTGRDQITRLHDMNGDGAADFYENFNNDVATAIDFHEFCFDLETDSAGDFYFTKAANMAGSRTPHQGTLLKLTQDGQRLDVIANGFRTPNGLCVTPGDALVVTDNQGPWIPSSKVNVVRSNEFYGNVAASYTSEQPSNFQSPLCWIPHSVDSSSADAIWVDSERWGPFQNHLVYLSYGNCAVFCVLTDVQPDAPYGAVTKLPLKFDSGLMRGRFSPIDGQLYLCGLTGWQTSGIKDGGLYRVRYTGQPAYLPLTFRATTNSLLITFSDAIDAVDAADAGNYSVRRWDYSWSGDYTSKEQEKRDVAVTMAKLADERTVELVLERVSPAMQLQIRYNITAADGSIIDGEVFATIHDTQSGRTAATQATKP